MLFSFRSADAAKYPRLLNVQTMEMAFDDAGIARLIKQGLAHYDEAQNAVVFTEFEKPRVQVIGSASEWPDVIGGEGFKENPIIVSQRVVSAFEQHSITGCRARPVEVIKKAGRKLDVRTAPQYYFLEVSGRIGMHVPTCIRANEVAADLAEKLKSAWDGSDVFSEPPSEVGSWALFCVERVFELARNERWTNCGFQPLHYFAPFHKRYLEHESALPLGRFGRAIHRSIEIMNGLPGPTTHEQERFCSSPAFSLGASRSTRICSFIVSRKFIDVVSASPFVGSA